jgi:hypothetical protein
MVLCLLGSKKRWQGLKTQLNLIIAVYLVIEVAILNDT